MAKSVVDFTGVPGLIKDIATAGSNDDPWYVDGVNFVKNTVKVASTPVRAAVGGLLAVGEASYELGGKVRREGVENILEQPFMYNKFKAPGESYADYTLRVEREKENISIGQAALSVLSPGRTAGDKSGWFQDWTDNNLRFLSSGFDIFNQEDRDAAFSDQYIGKFLSGVQVITASTIIDPQGANDETKLYLIVWTSHDGSVAVQAAVTPVRVVCQNTLNLAMRNAKQSFKIRHTQSVEGRIQVAQGNLNMTGEAYTQWTVDSYAWDWVAAELNLTIIGDYVPPTPEPIVEEAIEENIEDAI